ncbi:MAG: ABC transporter permease [Prevotella sp.]|nr:ABC transporter permease [Prevotella sp.]
MDQKEWDIIIQPNSKLFNLNLKEVWRYKDLLNMYVKRDIVTLYKQTILGPLWYLIQPLTTTIMFMFVFGGIAGISTDGLPQPLFYMAGILCWNYFSECLTRCADTFNANQNVFGKVYFPRLVVPLSIAISSLLKMAIQFALFIAIYLFYIFQGYSPQVTWYILLFPLLIILLAGLGLGFGLLISSMTTKYRDLKFLVSFGVQLWMYITPVIYPLSVLKNNYPQYVWAIVINPLTAVIETFKIGFLGQGTFSWTYLIYSIIFTIFIMTWGIVTFNKVQRSFMDTI